MSSYILVVDHYASPRVLLFNISTSSGNTPKLRKYPSNAILSDASIRIIVYRHQILGFYPKTANIITNIIIITHTTGSFSDNFLLAICYPLFSNEPKLLYAHIMDIKSMREPWRLFAKVVL